MEPRRVAKPAAARHPNRAPLRSLHVSLHFEVREEFAPRRWEDELTKTPGTSGAAPRVALWSLVAATYFIVSGGPYGLEELIAKAGFRAALWILLLTPLLWSLPTALAVGELSSAIPEEGGYYVWVRRALGPFWGFQEAWLSLAASLFDMAIYPTLFVLYLGQIAPGMGKGLPALAVGA